MTSATRRTRLVLPSPLPGRSRRGFDVGAWLLKRWQVLLPLFALAVLPGWAVLVAIAAVAYVVTWRRRHLTWREWRLPLEAFFDSWPALAGAGVLVCALVWAGRLPLLPLVGTVVALGAGFYLFGSRDGVGREQAEDGPPEAPLDYEQDLREEWQALPEEERAKRYDEAEERHAELLRGWAHATEVAGLCGWREAPAHVMTKREAEAHLRRLSTPEGKHAVQVEKLTTAPAPKKEPVPPEVLRTTYTVLGPRLEVQMRHGQTAAQYERAAEVLRHVYRYGDVRVAELAPGAVGLTFEISATRTVTEVVDGRVVERQETVGEAVNALRLQVVHPHLGGVATERYNLRVPEFGSITSDRRFPMGISEDRKLVELSFVDMNHAVVQGQTRSGKSVYVYWLLQNAAAMPDVRVVGSDQSGILLAPFAHSPRMDVAVGGADIPEHADALERVVEEMVRRNGELAARYEDKLSEFTPEQPLMLCVLEEYPGLLKAAADEDPGVEKRIKRSVSRLVAEGAKAGVRVLMLVQRADASIIGGNERANVSTRMTLRVDNAAAVRMLHEGLSDDRLAEKMRFSQPGVAMFEYAGKVTRLRTPYTTNPHLRTKDGKDFDQYKPYAYTVRRLVYEGDVATGLPSQPPELPALPTAPADAPLLASPHTSTGATVTQPSPVEDAPSTVAEELVVALVDRNFDEAQRRIERSSVPELREALTTLDRVRELVAREGEQVEGQLVQLDRTREAFAAVVEERARAEQVERVDDVSAEPEPEPVVAAPVPAVPAPAPVAAPEDAPVPALVAAPPAAPTPEPAVAPVPVAVPAPAPAPPAPSSTGRRTTPTTLRTLLKNREITQGVHRALEGAGVKTLDELAGWTPEQLLALPGVGQTKVDNLRGLLQRRGLDLASDEQGKGYRDGQQHR